MRKITLLFSFCAFFYIAKAQDEMPKQAVSFGFSAAALNKMTVMSSPLQYSHQIAGKPQLRYILGLRQTLAFGATEFNINKQTTLIDDISNYSINVMAGFEYVYKRKMTVGFNLDLVGGTIGTRSYKTIGKDPVYSMSAEGLNVLFSSGSLNSQVYVGYYIHPLLSLKIGVTNYRAGLQYSNATTSLTPASKSLVMPFFQFEYMLWP